MFAYITLILGITMGLLIPGLPFPAWVAEQVWDNELRRHLTEEGLNHAEVFMSEEDAVKIMLQKSQRVRKKIIRLSQEKKGLIEQRIGWKFPENAFDCTSARSATRSTAMLWSITRSANINI